MVELKFLGGAREVGRMGITVFNGSQRFLLEYGVNVEHMDMPQRPDMPVDALFLSHAHLDHSGHIPSLYKEGWKGRVYATRTTFDIANILLRDSLKVQKIKGLQPHYTAADIKSMDNRGINMYFGKRKKFKTAEVTFYDAGHVPGSSSVLLETGGKRILFTGDIKFEETLLMKGAHKDYSDIDVLITESTYSYKNHPDRKESVSRIQEKIRQTINRGGTVLLPSFAVGRSQEMLLAVADMGYPIYMDGMGIRVTRAALNNPESVRDNRALSRAFGRARKIRSHNQRKEALKKPAIIISTAGMLNGGPIHFYIQKLINNPDCIMILNGFQVPGTVGRVLMDSGRYIYEGMDVKPKMGMEFMDLSAHCGKDNLIGFIEKLSPEKTILVHGDRTQEFSKELNGRGINAVAPVMGDSIEV